LANVLAAVLAAVKILATVFPSSAAALTLCKPAPLPVKPVV